jgi:drug/metabolite transporter (DMT)-like permease
VKEPQLQGQLVRATSSVQDTHLSGILSMIAAVATFSVMDLSIKQLSAWYPEIQVTFLRGATSLPLLIFATGAQGKWRDLVPHRWDLHVVRGILGVLMLWLFVFAVKALSLADAYALFMSAPLLMTALSVPLLREHVGWRRWCAVLVGLVGVLIVLRPSGSSLITLGGLAAVGSALGYAFSALTIRILSRTDTGAATVIWSLVFVTLFSGAFCFVRWVPLSAAHVPWLLALGISGAIGQHLITRAFRSANPAILAPLEYTALAWGMLFDWIFWATVPGLRMLVGASIIIASGTYVIHRERITARVAS